MGFSWPLDVEVREALELMGRDGTVNVGHCASAVLAGLKNVLARCLETLALGEDSTAVLISAEG